VGRIFVKQQQTLPLEFDEGQSYPSPVKVRPTMDQERSNLEGQYNLMQNVDPQNFKTPHDVIEDIPDRRKDSFNTAVNDSYIEVGNNSLKNLMDDESALELYPKLWQEYQRVILEDEKYHNERKISDRHIPANIRRPGKMENFKRNLPGIRDFVSNQTTLPEHIPKYHSEKWLDEEGQPIPGAIPPINAVRIMDKNVINNIMGKTGSGLVPLYNESNHGYEKSRNDIKLPLPIKDNDNTFFLTGTSAHDIDNAVVPSHGREMVGIRGFNTKRDNAIVRPRVGHGEKVREGMVRNPISNTRLVPFKTPMGKWPHRAEVARHFKPRTNAGITEEGTNAHYLETLPLSYAGEDFEHMVDKYGFPKIHGKEMSPEQKNRIMSTPELLDALKGFNQSLRTGKMHTGTTPKSWGDRYEGLSNLSPEEKEEYISFIRNRGGH
tara:strand:- start:2187 stop:3491 length:1305 start_codon:yes stop_codon:yes gene_type:complete